MCAFWKHTPRETPMRWWWRRAALRTFKMLLALAPVLPVAARAGDGEFSGEELRRLEAGEILTRTRPVAGRSVPWMKASGLVDAPPAEVWPVLDDCARYKDTMPRTVESEELERHGDHILCRATVDMPFPFTELVTETDAVQTIEPGKLYRREWKQRSGDFNVNEGRWTLEPWRGGRCTLATYEVLAGAQDRPSRLRPAPRHAHHVARYDRGVARTLEGIRWRRELRRCFEELLAESISQKPRQCTYGPSGPKPSL